ncbi:MAG: peroxiredoxin [Deltaproteobacteria bacterium]|nr:MAG: peroxiredoxin [Deltaproteobacteria bacterium]
MTIQIGDTLPAGTLTENTPANKVDVLEALGTGKHVLFGVPGAFTPGCSKTHLPGYIADYDKWIAKGVQSINCMAVNDAFVMAAWGEAHGAAGKVRMLADADASYTKALGLDVESAGLGGTRCKRFAMVVEDGKVTHLQVEPDSFGLSCSLSDSLLAQL